MDDPMRELENTSSAYRRNVRETVAYNLACLMAGLRFEVVPAGELRVGDIISPDGDVIVTEPEYVSDDDVWVCDAHCPSTPKGQTFKVRQAPADVAVFGRA